MRSFCVFSFAFLGLSAAFAQTPEASSSGDAVRVNVTMNADGSRTTYQFDTANHKANATTSERDGKVREKIEYSLDQDNRFASSQVFGPDGKFRFKALYRYDPTGRPTDEVRKAKDGSVLMKIVYSYDEGGKQTGYSVYDGDGKLLGQTTPASPAPKPHKGK
jgi:YD repeat-containing protein